MPKRFSTWLAIGLAIFAMIIIPLGAMAANPAANTGVTATSLSVVKVRSGPGVSYAQVGKVNPGETYNVLGRDSSSLWIYIDYRPTLYGWVSVDYFLASENIAVVPVIDPANAPTPEGGQGSGGGSTGNFGVATVTVRIRAEPSTTAAILGSLPAGAQAEILQTSSDGRWYKINYTGIVGWVASQYIRLTTPTEPTSPTPTAPSGGGSSPTGQTATATTSVRIRSTPSTSGSVIGSIPAGGVADILGTSADGAWYNVRYSGIVGWSAAQYLRINDPNAVPTEPSPTGYTFTLTNFTTAMRTLYKNGLAKGNYANRFSTVGDSETNRGNFLSPYDTGDYDLGSYSTYKSIIDYYKGSFSRRGQAVNDGMMARIVTDPLWANPNTCLQNETPIECELRTYRPSIVIIMLRERLWFPDWRDTYLRDVRAVVNMALKYNAVPVLSTLPHIEEQATFNAYVRQVATELGVPLWDLAKSTDPLPNYGIGPDSVHLSNPEPHRIVLRPEHLSQYGLTVRNLQTLELLHYLKKELNK